jgi:hypothetical protein
MDYAQAMKFVAEDALDKDELNARHNYYATVNVIVEQDGVPISVETFVDLCTQEFRAITSKAEHEVRRYGSSIVGFTTEAEPLCWPNGDKGARLTFTFECTGTTREAPPRAVVLRALRYALIVNSVEYIETGMRVLTPQGVRTVVAVDAKHNVVELDRSAGRASFPLYCVGDPNAPEGWRK